MLFSFTCTLNLNINNIQEEGDEIKLKRIITSTKDAYTINGQSTPMEKVMKTLQSKLSKANPYYITSPKKVRLFETGRFLNIHPLFYFQIREICTSSTENSFAMLVDIAGSLEVFFFYLFNTLSTY